MQETKLTIKGMSCQHCKMTVENALEKHDLVSKAEVELESETATVKHEDRFKNVSELKELVEEAGYKAV